MGNGNTKEGIILRLDELDVEELRLNIKLKELQKKLNEMVPNEEKVELNQDLQNEYYSYFETDEPKWLVVGFEIEKIEDSELVKILQEKYELIYQSKGINKNYYYSLYRCR